MPTPKPKWPYRHETVLTPASNGQWKKKHKGKAYYFGPWNAPKAALERWRAEWPLIVRGETQKLTQTDRGDLKAALESYLNARRQDHERGELAWDSYREYKDICAGLLRVIGRTRDVAGIGPTDFQRVAIDIERLSPIRRGVWVTKTRTVFGWIERHYGLAIDFGHDFKGPARRVIRKQMNARQDKTLTAEQIHKLMAVANDQAKALILLGINGGYGNSDVAALPAEAVDLDAGIIDYHRHKTQARRVVPLWSETVDAIRKIIVPGQPLLFADAKGRPLVRRGTNDICRIMGELRNASGVKATFYGFRYTFATIAAETGDDHARALVMGHVIDGVAENYVLRFPRERLVKVVDHVHGWLLKGVRRGESL